MDLLQIIPKDFFTLQSMLTLAGATGAVFIVSNGIQAAFNYNPKWLALAIALVISLAGVYFSKGSGSDYFVGVVNGFLIYATAAGGTHILANNNGGSPTGTARTIAPPTVAIRTNKRSFLSQWW